MCNAGCARIILFVFNFVFWLAGGGVLGIGVWMKVDEKIVNYLHVVNIEGTDSLIDHAAWIFIVIGGFAFFVGFLGCCGAIRGSQCLLFVYALLVVVVMAAQVVGAILALIYRQKVESHLKTSMTEQIQDKYTADNDVGVAWDFLQTKLKCCGAKGPADYQNSVWWNSTHVNNTATFVPTSCCALKNDDPKAPVDEALCQKDASENKTTVSINSKGCYEELHNWFKQHTLILMIIGFGVGAIQILGITTACCLRSALKKEQAFVH